MSDKLEKFILENRDSFNTHIPDRNVWNRIESHLDRSTQIRLIYSLSMKIAAAFIFVLCCGIVLGIYVSRPHSGELNYALTPELQKFKEAETYYQHEVVLKLNEVNDFKTRKFVEEDLKQLDEIYDQLRMEMKKTNYSNSDILINAMLKNYKTKVDILESILNKQKEIKDNHEKISI